MEAAPTSTGTTVPAEKSGGFPPFKVETFPSQLFWLAVTFAFLFVVLWRFAGPRIQGVIAERRTRITYDLAQAEKHRRDSEAASAAYQSALTAARGRALALADENRKCIAGDVAGARQGRRAGGRSDGQGGGAHRRDPRARPRRMSPPRRKTRSPLSLRASSANP